MVNQGENEPRCRQCLEVAGEREGAFIFCAFLNQSIWGDSVMCPHGLNLMDCF